MTSISFVIRLLKSFIRLISSSKTRSTSGTHVEYLYAFFEILQHVFDPFPKNRNKKRRSKISRTRRENARCNALYVAREMISQYRAALMRALDALFAWHVDAPSVRAVKPL
ncbi:MAG: hypothetical protein SGJ19_14010 [Planctomycetia bacterium]|nr:hypothetical protein [Planctomycetia bacterium]